MLNLITAAICSRAFVHRATYTCMATCYVFACCMTDKPGLYGSMAFMYFILALKG
jgi:hypothetical protein